MIAISIAKMAKKSTTYASQIAPDAHHPVLAMSPVSRDISEAAMEYLQE
jgi:hypothetical protein